MDSVIKFFLVKGRLNYTLMTFIILLGIIGYAKMPKDVFPPIKLDRIIISGGYAGSSNDILDKMAVTKLEDELRTLSGVSKMETSIKNSRFSTTLTLEKGLDMNLILNDTKDIISNVKRYFPSDMDEPIAQVATLNIPLIAVVISSDSETIDNLIKIGKDIKTEFTKIDGISNVNLYAENDRSLEIFLDTKKIEMFNINKSVLINELKKFSYIYPAGKIEETGNHLFISTLNGNRTAEEILSIRLNLGGKIILLKDIATIEQKYKENNIITRFNGSQNVEMGVFKNETGDAIVLAESVKDMILKINANYPTVKINTYNDSSKKVRDRLNTVVSSILVGIILVGLSILLLVNSRLAFVVTIGIPTALLIGAFVIYIAGYSINLMTLLGTLLILGVLVDDAVLVAENIQRHIQMGEEKLQASINGTKEVLTPVLASSVTTIFAFMPIFALSNEMGEFLKMIPIVVMALVLASLIESFIFLPIHAHHTFKAGAKELDWSPVIKVYHSILEVTIRNSKIFVPLFVIGIPLLTMFMFSTMKYQLFPEFDSEKLFIRGSFNVNHRVEEISEKLKPIEQSILDMKEELQIKSVSLLAGYKQAGMGGVEIKQNVFEFFIELEKQKPQNFIDKYVTPMFAPSNDGIIGTREVGLVEIVDKLQAKFDTLKVEGLDELLIIRDKPAIAKYDVEIQVNSSDVQTLKDSLKILKDEIAKINGIIMFGDDAHFGIDEIKLKPNSYGESLGFTEGSFAQALAPYFLEMELSRSLGEEGIIQIITRAKNLESLELLKNFELTTLDGTKSVMLKEVAEFIKIQSFDSLFKIDGKSVKTVFANVNNQIITAVEVLQILEPTIEKLKNSGVNIELKGEQEQNQRMKKELGFALAISLFMIFMTLLIMFNSFSSTFIILSVIPFSVLGAVVGHKIMGVNFAMPSVIGIIGLAGVVINNGVVMLEFIRSATTFDNLLDRAALRLRPILITSLTTFIGLSTLIFFATGQAVILQPIAISLGYGLLWGTVLNLIYLPALFAVLNKKKFGI